MTAGCNAQSRVHGNRDWITPGACARARSRRRVAWDGRFMLARATLTLTTPPPPPAACCSAAPPRCPPAGDRPPYFCQLWPGTQVHQEIDG